MASWTDQKLYFLSEGAKLLGGNKPLPGSKKLLSGRNSVGLVVSVALHAVVIVVALTLRTPRNDSNPAPIAVRALAADTVETQVLEPLQTKPQFDRPRLTVAQPDIAIAEPIAASAPIAASVARNETPMPTAPITLPQFDADYLNNPAPKYPSLSRRMREEGIVLVRVLVLPNGLPEQVELKRSSGSSRLDDSALEAVRKWRFVPARRGTDTVAAWVVVPVEFNLTA